MESRKIDIEKWMSIVQVPQNYGTNGLNITGQVLLNRKDLNFLFYIY